MFANGPRRGKIVLYVKAKLTPVMEKKGRYFADETRRENTLSAEFGNSVLRVFVPCAIPWLIQAIKVLPTELSFYTSICSLLFLSIY